VVPAPDLVRVTTAMGVGDERDHAHRQCEGECHRKDDRRMHGRLLPRLSCVVSHRACASLDLQDGDIESGQGLRLGQRRPVECRGQQVDACRAQWLQIAADVLRKCPSGWPE
jgi:hypothetical protein